MLPTIPYDPTILPTIFDDQRAYQPSDGKLHDPDGELPRLCVRAYKPGLRLVGGYELKAIRHRLGDR